MKRSPSIDGPPALDLIEEAFHLLRQAPDAARIAYGLGTLPFVLAALYFWSDMSRGAEAELRLTSEALGLAALFAWMKVWQAVFARELLAHLCGQPSPAWRLRWLARVAALQLPLQAIGLFVLPPALVVLVPFGWFFAFFQNVTALGGGDSPSTLRELAGRAWRQAKLWPLQNHYVLKALWGLFAGIIALNWIVTLMGGPLLLKTLFGIETVFSQSPMAAFNSTLLAAVAALTYVCVDPMVKATYVLRCFYGESLRTGEDLRAELKEFAEPQEPRRPSLPAGAAGTARQRVALALLLGSAVLMSPLSHAAELEDSAPPRPTSPAVAPEALNRSIARVIEQREYRWRLPRAHKPLDDLLPKLTWWDAIWEAIGKGIKKVWTWVKDLIEYWNRWQKPSTASRRFGMDWFPGMQWVLLVLLLGVVGLGAVLLYRLWRRQQTQTPTEAAAQPVPVPDLTDENVGADQLPEEGWSRVARELLEKGEFRLALRAYYLASLAHLAERQFVTLAKFKSNRDYEQEVCRRGHALPKLPRVFGENLAVLERVWYGQHEVDGAGVQRFVRNVETLKAVG